MSKNNKPCNHKEVLMWAYSHQLQLWCNLLKVNIRKLNEEELNIHFSKKKALYNALIGKAFELQNLENKL